MKQISVKADFWKPDFASDFLRLSADFWYPFHRCEETNCTLLHMSKEKSAAGLRLPKRLEALRLSKQLTWDGMAALLEISPSMIYQVKRGERSLGDLVLHRLEECEIEAGLLSVQDASFARLVRNPELSQVLESGDAPNASHDNYIKMRLEVLADVIDTYDSVQIDALSERLKKLALADKQFGKVFDQMAEVVAQLRFRKQQKEDSQTPRVTRKKK
jgi:transcriptional regulator with XRE-family HTH domain